MKKVNTQKLSLTHLVGEPSATFATPPPLLLFLHGLGNNEEDLFSLMPYLDNRFLSVAARAPIVLEAGAYGWFNIEFTAWGVVADIDQAKRSLQLVLTLIDELIETYNADGRRVYIMGFSQGAIISLALALTHPERVAGAVLMSGCFPSAVLERELDLKALEGMPLLVIHGTNDPVLPIDHGDALRTRLSALPIKVTYREYPIGHEVSLESLRDVSTWLSHSLDECCIYG